MSQGTGAALCRSFKHAEARTSLDGGLQLAQARRDLGIHLPLARGLLREGVPVGAESLADLREAATS